MSNTSTLCPIETGVILAGALDRVDHHAVQQVRGDLLQKLKETFAQFDWTAEMVWRQEIIQESRIEPTSLIDIAREERDGRDWDFVFVITAADLITYYKPYAFAAISRSVDTAVISLARIDPRMDDPEAGAEDRTRRIAQRLAVLMQHAFGHFNSLEHEDDPDNIMFDLGNMADLDRLIPANWSSGQLERLAENLKLVADVRLEEGREFRTSGAIRFYIKGSWINRHEIADAIWTARPWEFPIRLNTLTTAAFSTAFVLIISAESWDLAASQSLASIGILAILCLLATTAYITQRQQLLVRRERRLSEQSVITNVSAVGIVLMGMAVTFTVTLVMAVGVSSLLFGSGLVGDWAGMRADEVSWRHYAFLAAFVASLSMIVGALGASFERQDYFRHITFVDEEL